MKLDKAIEILTQQDKDWPGHVNPDLRESIKLGIEALKRIDYCRSGEYNPPFELLPGEIPTDTPEPSPDEKKRLRESPLGKEPKG